MSRKAFIAAFLLLAGLSAQAQDFSFSALSPSGHTLYYSITDRTRHEVELVCPSAKYGSNSQRPWDGHIRPYGHVVVPSVVSHEGVDYSVVSIGWNAFYGCYDMRSLTLPSTLRDFKSTAFEYCRNLEEIVVHPDNPVFDSRGGCNAIIKTASNELVYGCRRTVIPRTVTAIAWYAFRGRGLQSITIPPSVKYISDQAFYGCWLAEVTIPATVEELGYGAFDDHMTLALEGSPLRLEAGHYRFDDFYDEEGYAHGICVVPCGMKQLYEQSAWGALLPLQRGLRGPHRHGRRHGGLHRVGLDRSGPLQRPSGRRLQQGRLRLRHPLGQHAHPYRGEGQQLPHACL